MHYQEFFKLLFRLAPSIPGLLLDGASTEYTCHFRWMDETFHTIVDLEIVPGKAAWHIRANISGLTSVNVDVAKIEWMAGVYASIATFVSLVRLGLAEVPIPEADYEGLAPSP